LIFGFLVQFGIALAHDNFIWREEYPKCKETRGGTCRKKVTWTLVAKPLSASSKPLSEMSLGWVDLAIV